MVICLGFIEISLLSLTFKSKILVSIKAVDTSNLSNSSELMTYSADYSLGGGVTVGLLYFDHEQTANSQIRTDADGIMSMISVGF